MKCLEQLWGSVARTRGGEAGSPDLKPLLLSVHNDVLTNPVNLPALKSSLVELLQYLVGSEFPPDLFFASRAGSSR